MEKIGKHNPRLRELRVALRSGSLTADGWLPVEGPHLVNEALRCGLEVSEVYVREGERPPAGIPRVYTVGAGTFAHLATTREPQGVIALVRPTEHRLDELISRTGLALVLCGLQDPGNVGAIIRLADAFECAGCIAVDPTAGFYNSKVVRASAGSVFKVPHVRFLHIEGIREALASARIRVVGTAPDAPMPIDQYGWEVPTAILLGNEGHGLSNDERQLCDTMLRIPYPGDVQSLNAANAAAILLYEATRVRHSTLRTTGR